MTYTREINLIQQGKAKEAIPLLIGRIGTDGHNPDLHTNLAIAFEDVGDVDRAERGYRLVLERWAGHPDAACNLADLLVRQSRFEEAGAALIGNPHPHCRAQLAMVKVEQLQTADAIADMKALAADSGYAADASVALGYSLHEGYDRAAHEAWLQKFVPWSEAPQATWDGKRPIRIGYTGDVFRHCAVANMLLPVLFKHDIDRFRIFVYSDVRRWDGVTGKLLSWIPDWRETADLSDGELEQLIRKDGIDVLIDTQGHKLNSRIMVHAKRPAPVQFSYIGYAGDTMIGVASDGVRRTGRNIDREVGWVYRPSDDAPPVSEPPSKANGFITFGSVNRAAKINAGVIAAWGKILVALPTARLIVTVKGGEKNTVALRQLVAGGIPVDRVALADRPATHADYLRLAEGFDVHLDTFPYGGGTTLCDMLWQGVPSFVLQGDEFWMGDKILAGADFAGLVAGSVTEYIAKASADWTTLAQVRANLRDRMRPLLDGAAVARRMEAACVAALNAQSPAAECCG